MTALQLKEELSTPLLNELHDHLWLVGRRSGDHIDPLHVHILKGRKIVIAEDPEMHLTWGPHVIYVKPIPDCLLVEKGWQGFFTQRNNRNAGIAGTRDPATFELKSSTSSSNDTASSTTGIDDFMTGDLTPTLIGFLRSHSYLVHRPSDFRLAQDNGLLPKEWTSQQWSAFARPFRQLNDTEVAKRYHYGQLRLSRLNWAVRIHNPKHAKTRWFFHVPWWSVGQYLRAVVVPIAFIYTSLSIILAAMQVMAAGSPGASSSTISPADNSQNQDAGNAKTQRVFWIFCIIVLVAMILLWILFVTIPIIILIWQLRFGFRHRQKKVTESASAV